MPQEELQIQLDLGKWFEGTRNKVPVEPLPREWRPSEEALKEPLLSGEKPHRPPQ